MNTLGKILNTFSLDTGISQKDVAEKVGFSTQRVNNYYRGQAMPPPDFYLKFKEVFSVDLYKEVQANEKTVNNRIVTSVNPIPVFDLELKPSSSPDFMAQTDLIIYYIDLPLFSDCDAAVKVTGSAMSPAFNPGDLILIKKVKNFFAIPFGEPFFIVTEEQKLLRYVKTNEANREESFILKAEDSNLDNITIRVKDIVELYQVKGKITRR